MLPLQRWPPPGIIGDMRSPDTPSSAPLRAMQDDLELQAPGENTERRAPLVRPISKGIFFWRSESRGPERLRGLMAHNNVQRMFNTIAGTYDLQNRFLAARVDNHWRNMFVRYLRLRPGALLGDMAVGTAEITIKACRRYPTIRIIGVDFSEGMLKVARRKIRSHDLEDRVELRTGDLRKIPVADATFDAVTISFGIRNIKERVQVLRECFRIMKPGGRLQIMEPSFPDAPIVRGLYRFYFDHLMPLFGNWISGTDYAYSYLAETVYVFPSDAEFLREIERAGFGKTDVVPLTFGMAKIYRGRKPA